MVLKFFEKGSAAQLILIVVCFSALNGCGVKGDPEPPLTPPRLGRGKATFTEVTEDLVKPQEDKSESENDEKANK